jgi:hypothetical protein
MGMSCLMEEAVVDLKFGQHLNLFGQHFNLFQGKRILKRVLNKWLINKSTLTIFKCSGNSFASLFQEEVGPYHLFQELMDNCLRMITQFSQIEQWYKNITQ